MTIPKVFVSYSHDNTEHKKWILDFAVRLRNNGIDAIIDQWELNAGDDIPSFMERNLENSDYVIMVCTENYVQKANAGKGGVGYEKMIITANFLKSINENKIIPIIRQKNSFDLPIFLKTKIYVDFSKAEDFEFSFDELIRTIHKSPLVEKPKIGNNPFLDTSEEKIETHSDIKDLMKAILDTYDKGLNSIHYEDIRRNLKIPRMKIELLWTEAIKLGLLKSNGENFVSLTEKGKSYAIDNRLF